MNDFSFALRQLRKAHRDIRGQNTVFSGVRAHNSVMLGVGEKGNTRRTGVGALDPIAFTVAPIVLAAAGLLATWLPPHRATRISAMAAWRTE